MKYFLSKKYFPSKISKIAFSLILLYSSFLWFDTSLIVSCSSFMSIASSTTTSSNVSEVPSTDSNRNCKCHHPFKRFISALRILEEENLLSPDDFKKLLEIIDQVPRETLNKVDDKDLALAHTLYQDKVLTETQYKKLTELLKTTLKKN